VEILMDMKLMEILKNPRTQEIRVAIKYRSLIWIVKFFDSSVNGLVSVKIFHDVKSYDQVKSFWSTTELVDDPHIFAEAKHLINHYSLLIRGGLNE